jgi:hypothetical protein
MDIFSPNGITLNLGDTVHRTDDPRHLGRVEAVHNTGQVKVAWQDSGWFEWLDGADLERLRCNHCGWKLPRVWCPHLAACPAMATLRASKRKPKPNGARR